MTKKSRTEYREEMEKYFTEENRAQEQRKVLFSPSGKYQLTLDTYQTKPGCWSYSRGRVFERDRLVADVKRNYHHFPFAWAEQHPNGHDYLICGEDYQGYTTIELDTGRRNDLQPNSYERRFTYKDSKTGEEKTGSVPAYPNGYGFCWASIHPSPDRMVLAVSGCFWAAPYEIVLYDFSEPMKFPYWELERWDDAEDFDAWETAGTLRLSRTLEVRKSDGKPLDDLSYEEMDKAEDASDIEERKLSKLWEPKNLPMSRSTVARREYERLLRTLFEVGTQSKEADFIRDLMDRPGEALSPEDRDAVGRLATELSAASKQVQP